MKDNNNYEDVTKEWLNKATPNSHKILNRLFYEDKKKNVYYVDNKKVVIEYNTDELETAIWLEKNFGGEIYMNPKINKPDNIKSADYFFKNENWDKKRLTNARSKSRAVDNAIKSSKLQANNFILDITGCKLSNKLIINQVKNIFSHNKYDRNWINKIIIVRNNKLIKVFIRKK